MNKFSGELHHGLGEFVCRKWGVVFVDIVPNVPNKMFLRKKINFSIYESHGIKCSFRFIDLIQAQAHYLLLMWFGVNIGEETKWDFLFLCQMENTQTVSL